MVDTAARDNLACMGNTIGMTAQPYRFRVVIEQDEDGIYCASIPALPGCLSSGDTHTEALANIKEAASLHIEVMRDHGDEIPASRPVSVEDIDIAV
jgi:predicted RNase H-like HicB family nuclease